MLHLGLGLGCVDRVVYSDAMVILREITSGDISYAWWSMMLYDHHDVTGAHCWQEDQQQSVSRCVYPAGRHNEVSLAWVIKPRPVLSCLSFSVLGKWFGHANKWFSSNLTSLIFLPFASDVIIKHNKTHIYGCVHVLSNIYLYKIVVLCLIKWFNFEGYCPYKSLRLPIIF